MDHSFENSVLIFISQRYAYIKKKVGYFIQVTLLLSMVGVAVTTMMKLESGAPSIIKSGVATYNNPELGLVISIIVYFITQFSLWIFVIWSLLFTVYVSYISYKSSTIFEAPVNLNAFKWVQLASATILPIFMFSIAWTGMPTLDIHQEPSFSLPGLVLILLGSISLAFIIYLINRLIPDGYLSAKFAIYSLILYTSVLMSFAFGIDIFTYIALFGILLYLMFDAKRAAAVLHEIALYDLDGEIYDQVKSIILANNRLTLSKSEEAIKRQEIADKQRSIVQEKSLTELNKTIVKNEKITKLEKANEEFHDSIDDTVFKDYEAKIEMVSKTANILTELHETKTTQEYERFLEKIEQGSSTLTTEQIEAELTKMMMIANNTSTLPQKIQQLKENLDHAIGIRVLEIEGTMSENGNVKFADLDEITKQKIIDEVNSESRKSHKVILLKQHGFDREECWKIISELDEDFNFVTFQFAWDKT